MRRSRDREGYVVNSTILALAFVAVFLAGAALLVFIWAARDGQFEDSDESSTFEVRGER